MTERRPHWSDDLIDAVRDAVDVEFDDIWKLSEDSILAVIAEVEDWARWEHVPKGTLARLEQAEAAIARVRDVCEQWQNYDAVDWATAPYLLVTDKLTAAKQILQALDGAS
jgi:hypothetical protein